MSQRIPTMVAGGAIRITVGNGGDVACHVAVTWGPLAGRLSPDEARACGLALIVAAEAAQTDEFIRHFARQISAPAQAPQQAARLQATVQRLRRPPNTEHERDGTDA